MRSIVWVSFLVLEACLAFVLPGCGNGDTSNPTPDGGTAHDSGGDGSPGVDSGKDSGGANTFTVGGNAVGLVTAGLVLQNNGADNLLVTATGAFTFATPVANASAYNVTILTQPSGQACSVASGSGTVAGANVTSVVVTCATPFKIGGSVTGLTGTGLVLANNGGDNLTVAANATSFTFATPLATGAAYAVTVDTQPATQTCTVTNGTGNVGSADVNNVAVSCGAIVPTTYPVHVAPGGSFTFSPGSKTIHKGDTIHWIWDSSGHNVTSGTALPGDGKFCFPVGATAGCNTQRDTLTANAGDTFDFTFTTAGTFPYFCGPHIGAGMKAQIVAQ